MCGMTFPVIWLGGLVTSTKAGMAVPDWPNTYGYNMFLYPLSWWLWGPWDLFVEHGHRLFASALGLCAIGLAVLLWRDIARPKWLRWMGVVALVAVIAQGVLGGARVLLDERWFAMIHGITGPLFFVITVALVVWTSRWWQAHEGKSGEAATDLRPLAMLLAVLTLTQLVLGALVRHLPAEFSPQSFQAAVRLHLVFATLILCTWPVVAYRARRSGERALRRTTEVLGLLLVVQILLGGLTWCYEYAVPRWVEESTGWHFGTIVADGWWQSLTVTAHQANGSLLLGGSCALVLVAWRLAPQPAAAALYSSQVSAPARSAIV